MGATWEGELAVFPTERPFPLGENWNLPSEDVETLKTCPGLEGIQRGCPASCQLFVLLAERTDMFLMLVLKLTVVIEPGHCVFKEVE